MKQFGILSGTFVAIGHAARRLVAAAPWPETLAERCPLSEASHPPAFWVDPGTHQEYPISYLAYRRAREAQEKTPPRHQGYGPKVDRYLARGWRDSPVPDVDILLTFRPDAPPRLRRIVSEVLRAIRRGRPARATRTCCEEC
jgi:hypothetical protein